MTGEDPSQKGDYSSLLGPEKKVKNGCLIMHFSKFLECIIFGRKLHLVGCRITGISSETFTAHFSGFLVQRTLISDMTFFIKIQQHLGLIYTLMANSGNGQMAFSLT